MSHQFSYPPNLPVPQDDGACDHLVGGIFPDEIVLSQTRPAESIDSEAADKISVGQLSKSGVVILFFYPRTAPPEENVPKEWDAIPGARGCTPQNCSYRDAYNTLIAAGLGPGRLFACSTQQPSVHKELITRLNLPYAILSDEDLVLTRALKLPTFEYQGKSLVKRLTLAIEKGKITKVWYPVFPPDKNAADVTAWLRERRIGSTME